MAQLDADLSRLAHRKRGLPEHAELTRLTDRRTQLAGRRVTLETEVSDLVREQRKADADVEQVKARRARNAERLETGAVSSPRELEQLQHEVATLERRITALEDAELEVMERLETAQATLAEVTAEQGEVEAAAATVESVRADAVDGIDEEARQALAEREQLASGIPEPLLALYERVRGQAEGVGAAALRRRRCEGCRLELTAADVADIAAAPSDEVLRCPECNRILVRTAESGL